MSTITNWRAARVYYYAQHRHTDVILDAVRPLLRELAASTDGAYFERHWLRGPHVRLNVRATTEEWCTQIRPRIEHSIGGYLAREPSTTRVDIDAALRKHRVLARLEQEHDVLEPWFPDNSVQFVPLDIRAAQRGGRAIADLLLSFQVASTPMVLQMLEHIRQGGARQELCLHLMFALAHVGCPPITRGFISYRSHAEYFLANCADPTRMRHDFEGRFSRNRQALDERLVDVVRALDADEPGPRFVAPWTELWRRYADRCTTLLESSDVDLDSAAGGPATVTSGFHQSLEHAGVWEQVQSSTWFLRYRLLLNMTYLQMNRLGCTPVERYLLCYLASRTVEEHYGITALDAARTLTRA